MTPNKIHTHFQVFHLSTCASIKHLQFEGKLQSLKMLYLIGPNGLVNQGYILSVF